MTSFWRSGRMGIAAKYRGSGQMYVRNAIILGVMVICGGCEAAFNTGLVINDVLVYSGLVYDVTHMHPHDYLQPTAPDGQSIWAWNIPKEYLNPFENTGDPRPSPQFLFTRDNTRILVQTNDSCLMDTLFVIVQFQVPEGNTVEVAEPKVKAAGATTLHVEAELRPIKEPFQFESMAGATRKNESAFGGPNQYKTYSASARIPLPNSRNYQLILPKTKVNGKEVEFAEVSLNRKTSPPSMEPLMACTNYQ